MEFIFFAFSIAIPIGIVVINVSRLDRIELFRIFYEYFYEKIQLFNC